MRLLADTRFGCRVLAKDKYFTLAVLLTLALCIGGNATIFSMLNALILRPLPFPESERIVEIYNTYLDDGRLALLLAVLDRRSSTEMLSHDVYVNVAGGVKVGEPGADLALALALASSRLDIPLPADVAAFGEVGLGGEVRRVGRSDLRLREAARMGFLRVLLPEGADLDPSTAGAEQIPIPDIASAVDWLRACSPVHAGVNNG